MLGYEYAVGEKDRSHPADPVSVHRVARVHTHTGGRSAIALHGALRVDTFGGLRGRRVGHRDGTPSSCPRHPDPSSPNAVTTAVPPDIGKPCRRSSLPGCYDVAPDHPSAGPSRSAMSVRICT